MERQGVAVCYGAGPRASVRWALDVAHRLIDDGVPLVDAPALGCSSGAWAAAAVALGVSTEELLRTPIEVPDRRPGALVEAASLVFGDRAVPTLSVVAVADGDATPVVLCCGAGPAAPIVAASSAVPGLFSPVDLAGTRFVDGVCGGSSTHVGHAPDGDLLVVIAPWLDAGFERGIARWRARNPDALITVFTPESTSMHDVQLVDALLGG